MREHLFCIRVQEVNLCIRNIEPHSSLDQNARLTANAAGFRFYKPNTWIDGDIIPRIEAKLINSE